MVLDCRELKLLFSGMHLRHEGRNTNKLADLLAKQARQEMTQMNELLTKQAPDVLCSNLYEKEFHSCLAQDGSVT